MVKVELFISQTCPYCPMARELLNKVMKNRKDIELIVYDIMDDRTKALEYGIMAIPAIAINDKIKFVGVPEEKELLAEL